MEMQNKTVSVELNITGRSFNRKINKVVKDICKKLNITEANINVSLVVTIQPAWEEHDNKVQGGQEK